MFPVLGDGNLKDPEVAKKAVEDGILDYVGLAHQMLADPYWPKKSKHIMKKISLHVLDVMNVYLLDLVENTTIVQ